MLAHQSGFSMPLTAVLIRFMIAGIRGTSFFGRVTNTRWCIHSTMKAVRFKQAAFVVPNRWSGLSTKPFSLRWLTRSLQRSTFRFHWSR